MRKNNDPWVPLSWTNFPVQQQPFYEDQKELKKVLRRIQSYPPIVSVTEIEQLKKQISNAAKGESFIIQGGDCAERFVDCHAKAIFTKVKMLMQMAAIVGFGLKKPIVKIGRLAGQYGKPRTSAYEVIRGNKVPSFRGDNIHSFVPELSSRKPDPRRLEQGYFCAALTHNYLRTFLLEDVTHFIHPDFWTLELELKYGIKDRFKEVMEQIIAALNFVKSMDYLSAYSKQKKVFTSHEGLLLALESAATRYVDDQKKFYNLSSHLLWIGDRTRNLDSAHVEYFRGIQNPIGIKIGPVFDPQEITEVIKTLNPLDEEGRIILIHRFGEKHILRCLPLLLDAVLESKLNVCWLCDPMHGNTMKTNKHIKTRRYQDILEETKLALSIHRDYQVPLGGVHFELTGEDVTECLGGELQDITMDDLVKNYSSLCDPRLNYTQSIEMALVLSQL